LVAPGLLIYKWSILDKTQLAQLAERYLQGTATEKEIALLHEWYDTVDREEIELVFTRERETGEEIGKRMFDGVQLAIQQEQQEVSRRRVVLFRRWMAAASVIIVLVFAGKYFWNARQSSGASRPVARVAKPGNDVPPGGNKARLLLGDGSVIDLGRAQNGTIKEEAGTRIDKKDGQLTYEAAKGDGAAGGDARSRTDRVPEMNTIETPRGGEYQVVLADGTKVWLNSASSLSYPTTFTGRDRIVQLKGEAYFEVAEDKDKPFKVNVGDLQVDVLGTHFDVMAYEDESAINTTLLGGAVRVTTKGSARWIGPRNR
jgi:transmembrane sensor